MAEGNGTALAHPPAGLPPGAPPGDDLEDAVDARLGRTPADRDRHGRQWRQYSRRNADGRRLAEELAAPGNPWGIDTLELHLDARHPGWWCAVESGTWFAEARATTPWLALCRALVGTPVAAWDAEQGWGPRDERAAPPAVPEQYRRAVPRQDEPSAS